MLKYLKSSKVKPWKHWTIILEKKTYSICRLLRADQESGSSPVNSLLLNSLKKSKVRIHQSIGQYYYKTTYSISRLLRADQSEGSVPLNPFENNDLCLDSQIKPKNNRKT